MNSDRRLPAVRVSLTQDEQVTIILALRELKEARADKYVDVNENDEPIYSRAVEACETVEQKIRAAVRAAGEKMRRRA